MSDDLQKPTSKKTNSSNPWQVAWTKGLAAAKRNRIPAFVMWLFGISLIVGYFFIAPVHDLLESLGEFKSRFGWKFSVISTGIFGGLIPAVIPMLLRQKKATSTIGFVVFSTLVWAYKGFEIDMFYHFQNWIFGNGLDVATIASKTFTDQLVMVPIFGMPNVVLLYLWQSNGYSVAKLWQSLTNGWYQSLVLPVLIANWVIWIPAVAMIYSLPIALQLPVQNMILCFWVLILVFFTENNEDDSEPASASGEAN